MTSSTPPKPRTKPADVRQEELMDAALALFVAKGIAATSIDEIVTAAGVSKGGFYHHFASKEALLEALQDRYISSFLSRMIAAQSAVAPDDWRGRINSWIRTGVDTFFDELAVHDVVFHEFAHSDRKEMNENPVVDYMESFLKNGMAAGAWTIPYPRLMAVMLFNATHGACDEAVLSPDTIGREDLIAALQDFCWRAVAPAGAI